MRRHHVASTLTTALVLSVILVAPASADDAHPATPPSTEPAAGAASLVAGATGFGQPEPASAFAPITHALLDADRKVLTAFVASYVRLT
jgi:hypothetical protein